MSSVTMSSVTLWVSTGWKIHYLHLEFFCSLKYYWWLAIIKNNRKGHIKFSVSKYLSNFIRTIIILIILIHISWNITYICLKENHLFQSIQFIKFCQMNTEVKPHFSQDILQLPQKVHPALCNQFLPSIPSPGNHWSNLCFYSSVFSIM